MIQNFISNCDVLKKYERTHMQKIRKYIKETTEERSQFYNIDDSNRDSNFYKLFLNDFISSIELIANQKTKLVLWLLKHMTKKNEILYTYREIAELTGTSYATVADTMKILLNADFLRRHSSGYYMVNPDIIYKGSYNLRCATWKRYKDLPKANAPLANDRLRLEKIDKNISRLEKNRKNISDRVEFLEYLERIENDQIE